MEQLIDFNNLEFYMLTYNNIDFSNYLMNKFPHQKTTIICFLDNNNDIIENYNANIIYAKNFHINNNILKKLSGTILFFINTKYSYYKYKTIIKSIIKIKNFCTKHLLKVGLITDNKILLGTICNSYSDLNEKIEDLNNSICCMFFDNKVDRLNYIYDKMCLFFDNNFKKNNYCDFKNNQCIANRNNRSSHSFMGCCYSFDYSKKAFKLIENEKQCQYLKDKTCSIECITCKMFTCKFLKKKGIFFDINKILLIDIFLNKKQKAIILTSFFIKKEDILSKLVKTCKQ